jgi:hypothetical protein
MYATNYKLLYSLQIRVLNLFNTVNSPFYLTGGTVLGRFYLNHRYSADLDFFVNDCKNFKKEITPFDNLIRKNFLLQTDGSLITDDFVRYLILHEDILLKIEFANDVGYRYGLPLKNNVYNQIDNIRNILSNKLTCIIGRDEPKDFFDIVCLSLAYKFNWVQIINEAKEKAFVNEIDISKRIAEFPVEWLLQIDWLNESPNLANLKMQQEIISNDILLGKDNSLCQTNQSLDEVSINFI